MDLHLYHAGNIQPKSFPLFYKWPYQSQVMDLNAGLWTVTKQQISRIEIAEMRFLRVVVGYLMIKNKMKM
jgi:hypothetical protein